jgi:hypothetical protein
MSCCVVVLLCLNDVSSHFCNTNIQELDECELQQVSTKPQFKEFKKPRCLELFSGKQLLSMWAKLSHPHGVFALSLYKVAES